MPCRLWLEKGARLRSRKLSSKRSIVMLLTTSILESSIVMVPMLLVMFGLAKVAYGPGE